MRDATTDADAIRRWWARWPEANVGIATGVESGITVLDVDPRHDGHATLDALEHEFGPLPETLTAETGGGGQHYHFAAPSGDLRSTLGAGLDVKHDGGYVVAPPSLHVSGSQYTWRAECAPDEVPLAELPATWLAALRRPARDATSAEPMPDCDEPVEVREHRARAYIARMPIAVSGDGGQPALWAVACVVVRGMMVPPERAMAVLRDYSSRCRPPWSERELAHTHESAQCRSVLPWGYLLRDERATSAPPRWERLVPLDHARELPAMPLETLPAWLRAMVAAVTTAYQVPPELPGMYALALVSGAMAGKYVVQVRPGWRMPPVLYVLVALPPSERKTPVIRDLAEPLRVYERAMAEEIADKRREKLALVKQARAREEAALRRVARPTKAMAEDLAARQHTQASRELEDAIAAVPPEARMLVEYATPEALAERMADWGDRQIILSDEGAGVLSMTGRYSRWGGADLDLLLRGYDGLPYTPARITRQARPMDAATLTIALAAQPAAVIDLLAHAPEIRERGLLARFLVLTPRPRVGSRRIRATAVPVGVRDKYERHMRALLEVADVHDDHGRLVPRELRLSRGADDVIAALETELEPEMGTGGRYERIAGVAGKLAGQAGRIAAVLHAAEHAGTTLPATIDAATAKNAVHIVRACLPHAESLEDRLAAPPELEGARRIAAWLHRNGRPRVTAREILRGTRGTVCLATAEQRDAALRLLARHGYVRPAGNAGPPRPGRPTERWEVHPTHLADRDTPRGADNMDSTPPDQPEDTLPQDSVHIVHDIPESAGVDL